MSQYSIEILKPAEIEFSQAYDWYDEQLVGLGRKFFKEISKYLSSISENPYKFAAKYDNELHFAPLKVFPYVIVYWVDETLETVFIVSIFHTSRNPKQFY
ncbi:type II toxin-antitoxin system RelE/ParE family toxin [Dyadobacter sp. CY326]|uniref:type II toxin-antitoxin system RelE/ParE family toxin n=1 Tax=Dyadobacter sp. CY326 TaxID=2907300 RepID=UPI001F3930C8|nr:type II toxin-antitoxin system RelE/ParE family toxin [Dyadobacter sp. CY326]MCE7065421.1 type II toxin-antitoxin system RelE/ParE family toxin [Dyadobacter sp. CY326]